jgi:hypothetical protein
MRMFWTFLPRNRSIIIQNAYLFLFHVAHFDSYFQAKYIGRQFHWFRSMHILRCETR